MNTSDSIFISISGILESLVFTCYCVKICYIVVLNLDYFLLRFLVGPLDFLLALYQTPVFYYASRIHSSQTYHISVNYAPYCVQWSPHVQYNLIHAQLSSANPSASCANLFHLGNQPHLQLGPRACPFKMEK